MRRCTSKNILLDSANGVDLYQSAHPQHLARSSPIRTSDIDPGLCYFVKSENIALCVQMGGMIRFLSAELQKRPFCIEAHILF